MSFLDDLKFNADGLIPAIIQDQASGRVLMMAWMNRASLEKTIETGRTWFWSRSRQKYWMKGESSGHVQVVKDIAFDCDGDTVLIQVEQSGAACHEGFRSCFFRSVGTGQSAAQVTEPQLLSPEQIYGQPRNHFVAGFIGIVNVFAVVVTAAAADGVRVRSDGLGEFEGVSGAPLAVGR